MEPIRPDDDEVRTGSAGSKPEEKLSAQREPRGAEKAAAAEKPSASQRGDAGAGGPRKPAGKAGKSSGGGGSGRGVMLGVGLLIVAGAAGAGWYQQEQRIQMLEGQLEEADYWARQSKLALARFEGELSETGESLQEKGQSIEDRLATQGSAWTPPTVKYGSSGEWPTTVTASGWMTMSPGWSPCVQTLMMARVDENHWQRPWKTWKPE